ncbi:hypothetical protein sos41_23940 [Alphaproteobacteria bacterium SO-S41]|nr:hypothetical protein sos41_23940 [Alphaproteobacteria bacterium SO-S41]
MRKLVLAGVLALGGCTTAFNEIDEGTRVVPLVSAQPSKPNAIRPGYAPLMTIDQLYAWCEYDTLKLQVTATAMSGGWRDARLNRITTQSDALTYEAVAVRPKGSVSQTLQRFTMTYQDPMTRGVARVRVVGQSNEMSATIFIGKGC